MSQQWYGWTFGCFSIFSPAAQIIPAIKSHICALSPPVSDGRGCSSSTGYHWDGCRHPYGLYLSGRRLLGRQACTSAHTSEMFEKTKKPKDWNLGSWSKALCIGQSSPCWGWEELFGKKQSWFSKSSPATWQLSRPVSFGTSVGGVLSCTSEALSWFLGLGVVSRWTPLLYYALFLQNLSC